jgi:hypothetical protein
VGTLARLTILCYERGREGDEGMDVATKNPMRNV